MANSAIHAALSELENFKIFEGMSKEIITDLCSEGHIVVSNHREMLYKQGDRAESFGIVLSGAYKLFKLSPQGEETIVHFSTPGDIIGALIMPQPAPIYPVSSHSMGPSRFLKLSRGVFLEKWKHHQELILKMQGLLSLRMGVFHAQKVLMKAPLSTKIAHLLMDILNKSETSESTLPLPLTRKEIADSLGASVESVIRIMSDWSKRGIIITEDHQIKILKVSVLLEELEKSL